MILLPRVATNLSGQWQGPVVVQEVHQLHQAQETDTTDVISRVCPLEPYLLPVGAETPNIEISSSEFSVDGLECAKVQRLTVIQGTEGYSEYKQTLIV